MSRYTDWTSGEPIEKEWAMTEPTTELTTEAILDAWVRTGRVPEGGWTVPRLVAAIQAEARDAALAAAEAAPLVYGPWSKTPHGNPCDHYAAGTYASDEDGDSQSCPRCGAVRYVQAAAEAAPLDVERLQRYSLGYGDPHMVPDPEGDYVLYAALRSPDTETAGEGS